MPDGLGLNMLGLAAHFEARMRALALRVRQEGAKATEEQMRDIHRVIIITSPVDTGRLRASWPPPTPRGSELIWGTGTTLAYAPTLEYGGYARVGPRTIQLAGGDIGEGFVADEGIYSKQAPLGFVRRALANAAKSYRNRLQQVIKRIDADATASVTFTGRNTGGGS